MAYLDQQQLEKMGFKHLGKNVKISDKASIYNADRIEIGDNSRIDDFCIVSGRVAIGTYCHITPMCLVAGGEPGIFLSDFCTFAYGVKVFAQTDDYSGESMVNSLIPKKYKKEVFEPVYLEKHVIVGAGTTIFPGVRIGEGCSIGAMSLVTKNIPEWGIYVGCPVKKIKERKRKIQDLTKIFLEEENDSV